MVPGSLDPTQRATGIVAVCAGELEDCTVTMAICTTSVVSPLGLAVSTRFLPDGCTLSHLTLAVAVQQVLPDTTDSDPIDTDLDKWLEDGNSDRDAPFS
jgi:hypothetical protein